MLRYRHGLLFAIVALSGCQAMSGLFQNRFASTPEYSTEEMLAMSQPLPSATSQDLSGGVMNAGAGSQDLNPVSLASYNQSNTPPQAGQNSAQSLVEAGQQAIRDAGADNPAGLQQARQLFQQALGIDATNADAHHGIAIVADLQKDWAAAEQHYKQALSGDPSNPSLLNDLGYSYLLQSRYHESQQYLNQAIQISPKHERAHLNLALLSLRRGNASAAQQTLAKIYNQQEIATNLSRLQQDLMKLNADSGGVGAAYPNSGGTMAAGMPLNVGNAVSQVSQSQPTDWNANRPQNQNYGQPLSPNVASQNYSTAGGVQHFTDAGGSMAIDPALRASDSQPVSVYPPGVIREEVNAAQTTQQNSGFSPGQQMPQNGAQAMANAGYPNSQFRNVPPNGQPTFQAFPGGNMGSNANMQMPGVNSVPNMMNQFPTVNSQSAGNQFQSNVGGSSQQDGFGSQSMGLNVGPGMPFPVGATGMNLQQGQFNPQSQSMAQPLLNQHGSGVMGMPDTGYGQANYGQANPENFNSMQANAAQANYGQADYGQADYGQADSRQLSPALRQNGQGQPEISQLPAHRQQQQQQLGQPPIGQFSSGQLNTQMISYGQPVGAPSAMGQANYGQTNLGQTNQGQANGNGQMPSQFPNAFNTGATQSGAMNGQAMYPNTQPQNFGQGMNSGMGNLPNAMPQGMNNQFNGGMQQGMQGGPMQQFEQQQMNRINDQYQQALQQMNGRGFPGQQ